MRSNVCKIASGNKHLDALLKECEKVAVYNELNHKQSLQLRLLCEELDGMLPNIIEDYDGNVWIEFENGVCKVNVSVKLEDLTLSKKDELIALAKNKKNAAVVGIKGKIRSAMENFMLADEIPQGYVVTTGMHNFATGFVDAMDYSYLWSLNHYRGIVNKEEQAEQWDELEKSVIASVADDVIVGVKGKQADIIIIKKFA